MLTRFFWIETPYVENLDRLENHQQRHATHHKSQTQQVQTNVVVLVAELLALPVVGRPKPIALHFRLLLAEILHYMACT